jgi:hypothetical protein
MAPGDHCDLSGARKSLMRTRIDRSIVYPERGYLCPWPGAGLRNGQAHVTGRSGFYRLAAGTCRMKNRSPGPVRMRECTPNTTHMSSSSPTSSTSNPLRR